MSTIVPRTRDDSRHKGSRTGSVMPPTRRRSRGYKVKCHYTDEEQIRNITHASGSAPAA